MAAQTATRMIIRLFFHMFKAAFMVSSLFLTPAYPEQMERSAGRPYAVFYLIFDFIPKARV
jgi:hypothetical protein